MHLYLKTITTFSLFSDNIEDTVHQLCPLGVVTLGPVVTSSRLSKDKVVGSEDLTKGSGPHTVHGPWLQVHEDGPGHVLASTGLVVVDVDPLQLEVRVPMVGASGVDTMLIRDYLPKLQTLSIIDKEIYLKTNLDMKYSWHNRVN